MRVDLDHPSHSEYVLYFYIVLHTEKECDVSMINTAVVLLYVYNVCPNFIVLTYSVLLYSDRLLWNQYKSYWVLTQKPKQLLCVIFLLMNR